jgi:hypothetical protein
MCSKNSISYVNEEEIDEEKLGRSITDLNEQIPMEVL